MFACPRPQSPLQNEQRPLRPGFHSLVPEENPNSALGNKLKPELEDTGRWEVQRGQTRGRPEVTPQTPGQQLPAGQSTEGGGQGAPRAAEPQRGRRRPDGQEIAVGSGARSRDQISRLTGPRELQQGGRGQAGWGNQGGFLEEAGCGGGLLGGTRVAP